MPSFLLATALLLPSPCFRQDDPVKAVDPGSFPRSTVLIAEGLSYADNLTIRAPKNFLRDYQARTEQGLVNAVVEIPAGACEKWEVKNDGVMRWDMKDGKPRTVTYLGYPCNYGMVPRTCLGKELGGDGDPLDMLVLGPSLPRGAVAPVRVIGMIRLIDAGKRDDKLIAVPENSPLSEATTLAELDELHPGITAILKTWFENYKGRGALQCRGFGEREEAQALLDSALESFASAR
jgi:inorganic pyrophosphatase